MCLDSYQNTLMHQKNGFLYHSFLHFCTLCSFFPLPPCLSLRNAVLVCVVSSITNLPLCLPCRSSKWRKWLLTSAVVPASSSSTIPRSSSLCQERSSPWPGTIQDSPPSGPQHMLFKWQSADETFVSLYFSEDSIVAFVSWI